MQQSTNIQNISNLGKPIKINNTVNTLKKYSNLIGGECFMIESLDDLYIKADELLMKKLIFNFVNLKFEINPNLANKVILQNNSENNNCNNLNFKNSYKNKIQANPQNFQNSSLLGLREDVDNLILKNNNFSTEKTFLANSNNIFNETFIKTSAKLNVDFKIFKQTYNNYNTEEFLIDRNEGITYKEKWPLPDDFLINKKIKNLPKKNSNLSFMVSNEIHFDVPCKIQDVDEYEISDYDLIIKIFEYFPNLTIEDLLNQFTIFELNREKNIENEQKNDGLSMEGNLHTQKSLNFLKIYFDLYLNIDNNNYNIYFSNVPMKPFAVLKLIIPMRLLKERNKKSVEQKEKFLDFLKKNLGFEIQPNKNMENNNNKEKSNNISQEKIKEKLNDKILDSIMENKIKNQNKEKEIPEDDLLIEKNLLENLNPKINQNSVNSQNKNNFINNPNNFSSHGIKFKINIMPYNYRQFFNLVSHFEKVLNFFIFYFF